MWKTTNYKGEEVVWYSQEYVSNLKEEIFKTIDHERELFKIEDGCEYCYMASAIERLLGRWKNY